MFVYTILFAVIFFILPDIAYSWGPGTHVEIAFSVIERLSQIAPAIAAVIAGREKWFVYGSVAADTVVGKKFAGEHDHCHNWSVGQKILASARTDRERAAAYGYLSHLAADVIAHNYYIPYMMIKSFKHRLLSHTYWEMRFDMHVRPEVWKRINQLAKEDFSPFDDLLEKNLKRAIFSFKTSKRIFSGILAIQRLKNLRRMVSFYAKGSRYKLDNKEVTHYLRLALSNSLFCLSKHESLKCKSSDPTGKEAIEYAKKARSQLKKLFNSGQFNTKDVLKFQEEARKILHDGVV